MPAKMARSAPRSAFGPPERPVSVGTSRLSCEKAVKRQYSPPVRASSEESPLKGNQYAKKRSHDRPMASVQPGNK